MSHTSEPPIKSRADEATISALARETSTSSDVVRTLYDDEVAALSREAKVTQFLGVVASRLVRQRLRGMHH